jgi:hypothetical protein
VVDEEAASRHGHDAIQGEVVSNALDFIIKEIVRGAEERKVAKLVCATSFHSSSFPPPPRPHIYHQASIRCFQ